MPHRTRRARAYVMIMHPWLSVDGRTDMTVVAVVVVVGEDMKT